MRRTFRRPAMSVAVLLTVIVPLACSSTPSSAPATSAAPTTVTEASTAVTQSGGSSPTPTSDSSAPPTPGSTPETFEANLTFGSGPFDLPNTTVGLADLSAYTATSTLTFRGTSAGKPTSWSTITTLAATNSPAARQMTVTKSGDVADPAPVLTVELNGVSYDKEGDSPCTADTIPAESPDPKESLAEPFEPAASLPAVIWADTAGSETVNDTPAAHYTFDEKALGQAGQTTSTGEVWVASTGGFVVKYVVTTKAGPDYFGDGIDGTIMWDYELTAVNQPVVITLPGDCPPGIVDAPQLPDATNVESLPGVLTYDTATSLSDIVAFYQTELGNRGWVPSGDPTVEDTSVIADFTQANATLTLTATIDAGVTTVELLITI